MWFYYWLQNANSIIDWKTRIQLYLQNFHYWLQNAIKRDSWSILQKSRIQLYLQNASHVRHANGHSLG